MRKEKDVRTQIRFGKVDLEVFCKEKGSEAAYEKVELDKIMKEESLPDYDLDKKWSVKAERPPRRKVDYGNSNKHQMSRGNSKSEVNKKQRTENEDEEEDEMSSASL